jgi:hypothetical protein
MPLRISKKGNLTNAGDTRLRHIDFWTFGSLYLMVWVMQSKYLYLFLQPDRKNGINLIPSRYHWDQLDAKVIVLDINFPVRNYNGIKLFILTNACARAQDKKFPLLAKNM